MQGRAFNAHYLTWFDLVHTELLNAALGSYRELVASGVDVVVAEANVRYLGAARYDDTLEIDVALEPLTTSSMTSRFTVRRDGAVITEARLRHVCVDATDFTKRAWPDAVRTALAPYVAADPEPVA
jgi:acyl-CoA thioester hydrolase